MWEKAGIIREKRGLTAADSQLTTFLANFTPGLSVPDLELGNMLTVALLMVKAALAREESRGGHYRSDFPFARPEMQKHSVLKWGDENVRYVSI